MDDFGVNYMKVFRRVTFGFAVFGYIGLVIIAILAVRSVGFRLDILMIIRCIVFIFFPSISLSSTSVSKKSNAFKFAKKLNCRLVSFIMFILFLLFFVISYVLLYQEVLTSLEGIASVAALVGSGAFIKTAYTYALIDTDNN